jgi:hypothetical protein
MSTIVEFTIDSDDFALGKAFRGARFDRVELDRAVPTTDTIIPFFWVYESDPDAVCEHLIASEHVTDARVLDELDGAALIRIDWEAALNGFLDAIVDQEARLLTARGTPERWAFQLRFQTDDDVALFQQACREEGIGLDITSVHDLREEDVGADTGPGTPTLTDPQREVLTAAVNEGYFAVPRETDLVSIAEKFGISDQAASERLRRALIKLTTPAVVADPDD